MDETKAGGTLVWNSRLATSCTVKSTVKAPGTYLPKDFKVKIKEVPAVPRPSGNLRTLAKGVLQIAKLCSDSASSTFHRVELRLSGEYSGILELKINTSWDPNYVSTDDDNNFLDSDSVVGSSRYGSARYEPSRLADVYTEVLASPRSFANATGTASPRREVIEEGKEPDIDVVKKLVGKATEKVLAEEGGDAAEGNEDPAVAAEDTASVPASPLLLLKGSSPQITGGDAEEELKRSNSASLKGSDECPSAKRIKLSQDPTQYVSALALRLSPDEEELAVTVRLAAPKVPDGTVSVSLLPREKALAFPSELTTAAPSATTVDSAQEAAVSSTFSPQPESRVSQESIESTVPPAEPTVTNLSSETSGLCAESVGMQPDSEVDTILPRQVSRIQRKPVETKRRGPLRAVLLGTAALVVGAILQPKLARKKSEVPSDE
ncbi:hypothetical protein CYMTET_17653 [Cymbomonas tetramitiformis]|uniref:C2 NT-type domain-containing protein n=1 Tax=Cymbomonas tetramitiformis TaxID=36881 RepID=A0AAE0FQE2_9CHLO|nr:hypothetical protein CYMTET_27376 [Cymbomonas tetramitiformis]KAK3274152.1 hypothetical protein CYMTET_17653 [Cymbomonas tetramitiformis]|eukprot:gene23680-28700_t